MADAIDHLILNPELAQKMGEIGKKLVYAKFYWEQEEIKLINFYKDILI
jgi:glycosyltransferase involved in cell wall biosynthesis